MKKKKLLIMGIIVAVAVCGIAGYNGMATKADNATIQTMAEKEPEEPKDTATSEKEEVAENAEEEKQEEENNSEPEEKGQGNGVALEVAETGAEEKAELSDELAEDSTDLYENSVIETETDEEEEYIQTMVEEGEMSAEVEKVDVEALDETRYATMNVRLREGTAVTTEAIRTIQFAESVHVTGKTVDGQWFKVTDSQDNEGYVASSYLSLEKPSQNVSEQQQASSNGGGSGSGSSGGGQQTQTQEQSNPSSIPGVSADEYDAFMSAFGGFSTELPPEGGLTGASGGGYTLGY